LDERKGEVPIAAIGLKPVTLLTKPQLEASCRDNLAGYKIPRKLVIVNALRRVHGWKLLRRDLRKKFGGSGF
ncbi:MAG: acyl-CoA synthetase, partial [Methanomicrobiales archaeon]